MIKRLAITMLILFNAWPLWALNYEKPMDETGHLRPDLVFRQSIPAIANQFIGIPYRFGGNPIRSGTSDNSYLFFSIYTLAAQKAGLVYYGYLPMKQLIEHLMPVKSGSIRNGDLMVLNNHLAAMVYQVESSGRLHLIYTSKKRNRVISFNSDNIVFHVFWKENLKGFYRIDPSMLTQDR